MKHTKKVSAFVGACVLVTAFFVGIRLQSMKPTEFTLKSRSRRRGVQPVQQQEQPRYKSETVWVKTSDNILMEVPRWQIDQMKVLQVLLVHQKGGNSKENPADASMVTSEQLASIQKALQNASDLEKFRKFYGSLSDDQQKSLLADAFTLGMQGLASLLITYMFPLELQEKMGATIAMGTSAFQLVGIIAPVIKYLQEPEKISVHHKGSVIAAQFSPDGGRIISGAAGVGNNLILYDVKTSKEILLDKGNPVLVSCLAFSPDGRYIITGSLRHLNNLILWDGKTGELIKSFGGFEGRMVNCVAFSPDGKRLIVGSENALKPNNPAIYNVAAGNMIHGFNDNSEPVVSVLFNPSGSEILVGYRGTANLVSYDSETYKRIGGLNIPVLNSKCLSFSPNGKYILTEVTSHLGLVDIARKKWAQSFYVEYKTIKGRVTCAAFDLTGEYIVAGSTKKGLVLLNGETGKLIKSSLDNFVGDVSCVEFSHDGNFVLCGGDQGLMLFKMTNPQTLYYIATQLNIAQARFLYRLYLAKINNVPVILDAQDLDYQIFMTLPNDVQKVVKAFLPFELASDIFEKEIQQKMKELRSSLFYVSGYVYGKTEKTHDEKIKAVKNAMLKFDQHSPAYKACERLLIELEQEEAFKAIG